MERSEKSSRQSSFNPEGLKKNSTNNKGKKNPLGDNGKVQNVLIVRAKIILA